MNNKPRVPPVPPREWSDTAREAIAILSEQASKIGLDPSDDTHVHNLVCTQLQHPELMKFYFPFLRFLLYTGSLEPRYRELAILRVAWLRQAEYEWTQHVLISRGLGITDDEIRQLTNKPDLSYWDPTEAAVIQAVDELIASACISDETWSRLQPRLGVKKLIELIHVIGNYELIAMFMKSTGLELESGLENARFAHFTNA
jgi:4-carboxymuconolactone decarboxylase